MKRFKYLLNNTTIIKSIGDLDVNVRHIQYDSRKILPGDLFVAVRGEKYDGHDFVDAAVEKGASSVVCEEFRSDISVPCVTVEDSRAALARISSAYYEHPARSLMIIGITGTNGKTSTAYLIENAIKAGGHTTGLLSTIYYRVGSEEHPAKWTTPEPLELQQYLNSMREQQTDSVVMEVSSHALEQSRVDGIAFRLAVFTNLSQDHLDYHRSMERYISAKQRLFRQVDSDKGENIINGDDPVGMRMKDQNHRPVLFYSAKKGKADVFPISAELLRSGITASFKTPKGTINIRSHLIGKHNLYNIMAAVCAGISLNINPEQIELGINETKIIPGRLESVNAGQTFTVLVDYAHTPDAMQKVIDAIRPLIPGRLIAVFGCGGDRDRGKRPIMGGIAEKSADVAILTSDNPRTEEPHNIIKDVLTGIKDVSKVEAIVDRTQAIHQALDTAKDDDGVLILGKGHETYQVLGEKTIHFDDREVVRNYLKNTIH